MCAEQLSELEYCQRREIVHMLSDRVLLLLDSQVLTRSISKGISTELNFRPCVVHNFAQAREMIESFPGGFLAAITNPTFGGGASPEAVRLFLEAQIPCVAITATFSLKVREDLLNIGVLDYLIQDGQCIVHLCRLLKRLHSDHATKVLVVDDSLTSRNFITRQLQQHRLQVIPAEEGTTALELLDRHRDVRLAIVDYEMPGMTGVELTTRLRELKSRDELAIIGLSGHLHHSTMTAEFLKHGANDFLAKPFLPEEFSCRVMQNLETLEHITALRAAKVEAERLSRTDPLTGIYNRRAFFERAHSELRRARRNKSSLSLLILDVDRFKRINDTYGHNIGDKVLKALTVKSLRTLREYDVFARLGGEEFVALLPDTDPAEALATGERLRRALAGITVASSNNEALRFTVSVGVSCVALEKDSIESTLKRA